MACLKLAGVRENRSTQSDFQQRGELEMKRYLLKSLSAVLLSLMLIAAVSAAQQPSPQSRQPSPDAQARLQQRLVTEVRHQLVMLPYYSVFDNLAYRVDGDTVTLYGQVTRPTLKSDAENVVKRIPGVARLTNQIEVLPLSPFDNQVRRGVFRAIYSQPALNRYALGVVPGIHIIVRNGRVT